MFTLGPHASSEWSYPSLKLVFGVTMALHHHRLLPLTIFVISASKTECLPHVLAALLSIFKLCNT